MALQLKDSWIWDSWYVEVDGVHHAFYLKASRALGDPERRHRHVVIGHAVSHDLLTWVEEADALAGRIMSELGATEDDFDVLAAAWDRACLLYTSPSPRD